MHAYMKQQRILYIILRYIRVYVLLIGCLFYKTDEEHRRENKQSRYIPVYICIHMHVQAAPIRYNTNLESVINSWAYSYMTINCVRKREIVLIWWGEMSSVFRNLLIWVVKCLPNLGVKFQRMGIAFYIIIANTYWNEHYFLTFGVLIVIKITLWNIYIVPFFLINRNWNL